MVFVNFTGYACTNCHWMKANMFTRPEIADAMNNFVLVELYTDGTDAASEANQKLKKPNSRPSPFPTTPSWTRMKKWSQLPRPDPRPAGVPGVSGSGRARARIPPG